MQTATTRKPQYTGFLKGFLSDSQRCADLRAHYEKLAHSKRRVKPATLDAIWHGAWHLEESVKQDVRKLTERGQLLFAHQDTTFFQLRAEVPA